MLLSQRGPSSNWEPVPLEPSGQFVVWAWFQPAAMPNGLMLSVPAALFFVPQITPLLTVRRLVEATGLGGEQIQFWAINGFNFDAAVSSSMLDQMLPMPASDGQVQLTVWMHEPQPEQPSGLWGEEASLNQLPMPDMDISPSPLAGTRDEQLLMAIDTHWNNIRTLESKVGTIRKQLEQSVSRLNSLNRDLTSDERRVTDNRDTKDWQDARRWLRDSILALSRSVKEIDIGGTSGAGPRHRFEAMHRQYVVPRVPFAGMEQFIIELETHTKSLQNVVAAAQASLTRAGRDAEQRASSVLQRIAMKLRANRR